MYIKTFNEAFKKMLVMYLNNLSQAFEKSKMFIEKL